MAKRNFTEVRIGDEWVKYPGSEEDFRRDFVMPIVAEEKEKRIWRPLDTVIGWQEFKQ